MTQYEKMHDMKVEKLCASLFLPTMVSMLVTSIYSMADTYFVTHIDDSAGAAVSVVFSLQTLIQTIGYTIGMGTGSLLSRALGAKDEHHAHQYASQGILSGLIFGVIFLTIGMFLNGKIMKLLGSTDTALPYAESFAFYIFLAAPFMILSFIMNNILRSEGKARLSMIGLGFGGILNIGLDPLFIYAFHMGIGGAGCATMISQMTSFLILASFFLFGKTVTKIHPKYITRDVKSYLKAFYTGSPTLFRQGFSTSANIIMNFLAGPYGDAVVAALGITNKIYLFVRSMVIGIGQGYQPVLGFAFGARQYDRIRRAFRFTLLLQTCISVTAALIVLIFPNALISFFSNSDDVIKVGIYSVRFLAIALPFLGFSTIVNQSLQVTGYAISASFLASCRQGIIYTPTVFLLEKLFTSTGLCLSQPVSDLLTAAVSLPFCFYFFNILKKKENEQVPELNSDND